MSIDTLLAFAPLGTFIVAMMMGPPLIRKFPKTERIEPVNERGWLYWGLGCLGVIVAFMVGCLALPH